MKKNRIWVVKIGSQLLVEEGPMLIKSLMRDVKTLKKIGIDVVWVTSGAIAMASQQLSRKWKSLQEKQAMSAIGQPLLMQLYNTALAFEGLRGGQVLLTAEDLRRKDSRRNLLNTLRTLLEWDIVPILNENDAVATEEIQFGDNDALSALVATQLKAERLVILTNVDGLYDRDPLEPGAKLISEANRISLKLLNNLKKSSLSASGRGGIFSKVKAALFAKRYGVITSIANGSSGQVLVALAKGQKVGTTIHL